MIAVFRMRMSQLRTNVMAPKTVPKVQHQYSVMRFQYKTMDFDQIHLLIINQNSEANLQLSESIMQLNDSTVLIYLLT
jgi:hypothetical protein